jgi:hypothetical protein
VKMTTAPKHHDPAEDLTRELESRQRNTTHPDLLANASNADSLMWHGSRRITKVQRLGVGLFGLAFVLSGVALFNVMFHVGARIFLVIPAGFCGVGGKLLWNAFRKNDPPALQKDDLD